MLGRPLFVLDFWHRIYAVTITRTTSQTIKSHIKDPFLCTLINEHVVQSVTYNLEVFKYIKCSYVVFVTMLRS